MWSVRSTAVARGVRGHAPLEKNFQMDSLRHTGTFSAQHKDISRLTYRTADDIGGSGEQLFSHHILELMSCLPRLTTNVSCGFALLLHMSKSFALSNSKGGALMIQGGANTPPPPCPPK